MTAYLATGLAVLVIVAAPFVALSIITRRRRGLPPATPWQIRQANRRRRLRLGLG